MTELVIDHDFLRTYLGNHNLYRLVRFDLYKAGWDGPGSMPKNRNSVPLMQRYFRKFYPEDFKAPEPNPSGLSIFMTHEGNISLNWVVNKKIVELTFLDDDKSVILYEENDEKETTLDINTDDIPVYI